MTSTYITPSRKIDPSRPIPTKPDGTPDDNDRVEIGPTQLAFDEWAEAGLEIPNLAAMREFRLQRVVDALQARDYGGIILFDPLNIRYASDTTNMQLWNSHNPFRACFVGADGYMVVWDFKPGNLLTGFNPLVRETRGSASFFYFVNGDKINDDAKRFAQELDDVLGEHSGGNRRLAVDKIMVHGLRALDALGLEVHDGEEVMEKARSIKGQEDLRAMRCAMHSCETAMYEMQRQTTPGMTENDVWAILHAENIRRGGEWIETRLLSSGQRTNPWFQECGPRILQNNEILAFDTDLIGPYGMCADISRTWFIGDGKPNEEQRRLFREAHAQIIENTEILEPGKTFTDLVFGGRHYPEEFIPQAYSVKMHGVGLCDEWPCVLYPHSYREGAFEYTIEPGMVFCVETYLGAVGGKEGIKLEDQVVITEDGHECITHYPFDERLLS